MDADNLAKPRQSIISEVFLSKRPTDEPSETVAKNSALMQAAIDGLRHIAAMDGDKATFRNGVGFSRYTWKTGNWLAGLDTLTERQLKTAINICKFHSRQFPKEIGERFSRAIDRRQSFMFSIVWSTLGTFRPTKAYRLSPII